MKKIISISVSILFFSLIVYSQNTNEYLYGDWFQFRSHWANVEGRPDLKIFESDSVYFNQTLFVNPCSFDFNGHIESNTIVYISKMRCLNMEAKKWTGYRNDTVIYEVLESEENYLKIINSSNKEELIYRKRNQFSDFQNLLVSKSWSQSVHDAMTDWGMTLKSHSPNVPASDSTNSVWKFENDNNLYIDYGLFSDTLQWQLSKDSTLELFSRRQLLDKYKITKIRQYDLNLLKLNSRICEVNQKEVIGTFKNRIKKEGRIFRIEVKADCSYKFYKASTSGEFKVHYGYFELKNGKLILRPITYTYREDEPDGIYKSKSAVWKFANKQEIELDFYTNSNVLTIKYEDKNGKIYYLDKKE